MEKVEFSAIIEFLGTTTLIFLLAIYATIAALAVVFTIRWTWNKFLVRR